MALIVGNTTGLERVGRELLKALYASLNQEIYVQTSVWGPLDQGFTAAMGVGYDPCVLETLGSDRFSFGHRPSLIASPIFRYPHVSVIPRSVRSGGDTSLDQYFGINDAVGVEVLVKAGPYNDDDTSGTGEELVTKRMLRTIDAVAITLSRARTLGGVVEELPDPVSIDISEVFVAHGDSVDQQWFWQGGILEYTIPRVARAY